ncbi:MAG: hypothetical protein R3Y64_03950 [Peptostreptococcaceae bacterium]
MNGVSDLKTDFKNKNIVEENLSLKEEIASLKSKNQNLKNDKLFIEEKYKDLQESNSDLNQELNNVKNQTANLNTMLENNIEEIENLKGDISYKSVEIDNLQKNVNKCEYIINENKIEIEGLQDKVIKFRGYITENEEQISNQETEINSFTKELNKYLKLQNVYDTYLNLNQNTKNGLSGIFRNIETVDQFLFCCSDEKKISMLWEYIKNAIVNDKEDTEDMKVIFDYFFETHNNSNGNYYERMNVNEGVEFDTDIHTRKGNVPSGEIRKVHFAGYKSSSRIVQKTLVEL